MSVKVANRRTARTLDERRSFEDVRISSRRTLSTGDTVKIQGERGEFVFKWGELDGSLTFWGGDRNPLGHRGFRSFAASRVKTIRRG